MDNDGGKPIPTWQCFVDGILFGNTTSTGITENSIALCSSEPIPDGTHHVSVSIVTSGPIFYFDYIYYTPSPSISLEKIVVKIDNNDTDLRFIGQGWDVRYANLWPLTQFKGDQMLFPFYGKHPDPRSDVSFIRCLGSSVSFFGDSPSELSGKSSSGTYAIDNSAQTPFTIPGHAGSLAEFNQLLFRTHDVGCGSHILVVTYLGNSEQAPLVLGHLYIDNGQTQPSAPALLSSLTSVVDLTLAGST